MEQKSLPNTVWYFALESLKSRYTEQLGRWMPDALRMYHGNVKEIQGFVPEMQSDINQGEVLDYVGRSRWCMSQCEVFLQLIQDGEVKSGDVIYLQDFWTPGIEAIFYSLDLLGIKVRTYAMLHAQSVDEYDFTYKLRGWMRHIELGIDAHLDGIFVASTIHREQLRAAGFKAPIHVVGLPFSDTDCFDTIPTAIDGKVRSNVVIYTSRLDTEKNPHFMLDVARLFLDDNPGWKWVITTSRDRLVSNDPSVLTRIQQMRDRYANFQVAVGCTKEHYYTMLWNAKIQFNSSLQDYVSWTLLEATTFGCDIVYPRFRSFPEVIPVDRMYQAFDHIDALRVLSDAVKDKQLHNLLPHACDVGRHAAAFIACKSIDREINLWHEHRAIVEMVGV